MSPFFSRFGRAVTVNPKSSNLEGFLVYVSTSVLLISVKLN